MPMPTTPCCCYPQAWSLLAIFITTIIGLLLEPCPTGGWVLLCVSAALACRVLTFQQAFQAVTNDVIWLIVVSFFLAKVRGTML